MNKEEFKERIKDAIDHISNGEVEKNNKILHGHPFFYLLHTKEEFEKELERNINGKETFTKYDFNYILNHMIKYELNQYDSHTHAFFYDSKLIPIQFKIIDNKVYIVNSLYKDYIGMEVKTINGVDINQIIKELDYIICYASKDYFNIRAEFELKNVAVLKSLPSIGDVDKIIYSGEHSSLTIDINNIEKMNVKRTIQNYDIDIVDDTLILRYLSCSDEEKMIETIETIKNTEGINHYIVNLRGNGGGNSSINSHLVEFLKGKDTYVLSDEKVFSSARMCLADLKRNGALVLGKRPGTTISCFGNLGAKKEYEDIKMIVYGSVNYWYYDEELNCHGFNKEDFVENIKKNPEILDIKYLDVDLEVENTLEDYINNHDAVLEYTLNYIKENARNYNR